MDTLRCVSDELESQDHTQIDEMEKSEISKTKTFENHKSGHGSAWELSVVTISPKQTQRHALDIYITVLEILEPAPQGMGAPKALPSKPTRVTSFC